MGLTPVTKKKPKSRKQATNVTIQSQLDYARNGHTVLRSFLDPTHLRGIRKDIMTHINQQTLDAWRQKVEVASDSPKLAQSCHTIQDCQEALDGIGVASDNLPFLQFFNTWRSLESVKTLAHELLGQTASILLDVPCIRLYQDSVFWKRAGDGPTPWHTDARMAPFDTSHMLTFWISLEEVVEDTGLIFCSKSHSDFALPFWNDFEGPEYQRLEERYRHQHSCVNYMPLRLGDVTVHSGWTLHCTDGNVKVNDRVALAISFVDARAEVREDALGQCNSGGYGDNEDQWSYKAWVQDIKPRQQFRHELVPIVWPTESKA